MSAASFYAKMKADLAAKAAGSAAASPAGGAAPAAGAASSAAAPAPAAEETNKVAPPTITPPKKPVLLVFGATDWDNEGKKPGMQTDEAPNLTGPHRLLAGLGAAKISFIASHCTSAHCIALAQSGGAYAWGRNESGQLGLGDTVTRPGPVPIDSLLGSGSTVVSAATGKAHTLFLLEGGEVHACGASKQGCVGSKFNTRAEFESTPIKVAGLPDGFKAGGVACGANFCLVRGTESGAWAFGWSQYGVMGNGSDGEFNKSDSSVKLSYEAQPPKPIEAFEGKEVVIVACGTSHCVAVEANGTTYTWGYGGYGRLGHKDQNDQWKPKPIELVRANTVSCGAAYTAVTGYPVLRTGSVAWAAEPSLYMWGRVKAASQDPWMYPKPEEELRGWAIKALSCGSSHTVVAADDAVISWGPTCLNGELGFGDGDKKSSAKPKKVDSLDGLVVAQVACGAAHTLILAEHDAKIVDKLPEWTPAPAQVPSGGSDGKRKADAKPPAAKKPKK